MTTGTLVSVHSALALINPAGMVERSTDEFTRRCNGAAALIERDPHIERVLTGQVDRAKVTVEACRWRSRRSAAPTACVMHL